jgi:hypothetical protein
MRRKILARFMLMALTIANSNLLAEGSKQQKDFTVTKTTILNIPKDTSGIIKYKLPKGKFLLEIVSLDKKSNMYLDDCIVNSIYTEDEFLNNAIGAYDIKPLYYKFYVENLDKKTLYIQGYITTTIRGKILIKVRKIGSMPKKNEGFYAHK